MKLRCAVRNVSVGRYTSLPTKVKHLQHILLKTLSETPKLTTIHWTKKKKKMDPRLTANWNSEERCTGYQSRWGSWNLPSFVKIDPTKATVALWAQIKLHLLVYRERVCFSEKNALINSVYFVRECRSQQPCGLRSGSVAVRLLGLWVRIPLGGDFSCDCSVLWSGGLCDELITCPGKSYRVWSWNLNNEKAQAYYVCRAIKKSGIIKFVIILRTVLHKIKTRYKQPFLCQ